MAHSLSAKKRIRQNEKLRIANKSRKSAMRTAMKRVFEAVESKQLDEAKGALPRAMKLIDKAAKANTIHANTAARRKSRISRAVASLEAQGASN
ncbi:MAG: 30S ribosomal protein S20 [Planctomycetes bacterium]|nr:30S ribosomal protein S20 [Planctomycetota bacterium]